MWSRIENLKYLLKKNQILRIPFFYFTSTSHNHRHFYCLQDLCLVGVRARILNKLEGKNDIFLQSNGTDHAKLQYDSKEIRKNGYIYWFERTLKFENAFTIDPHANSEPLNLLDDFLNRSLV